MKKITIDDFFSISSLLKGSPEDFQIAVSNLDNLKFSDKYIVDLLFAKSLSLGTRTAFLSCGTVKIKKRDTLLIGRNLFNYIKANGNSNLYKQILYRIMNT
jgi:hypothetical protein|tara:strand:+ start:99 stop:401 length:303 start_codon:yes stop_codon:yes gene_type:complete